MNTSSAVHARPAYSHAAPEPGTLSELAPGILWLRLALPFALNHVNIHIIDDGSGWTVVDSGVADDRTRQVWDAMLAGPLAGRRVNRLVVTHFHPDHVGLAGWLCDKLGVGVTMSQTEYLQSRLSRGRSGGVDSNAHRPFYARHGLSDDNIHAVTVRGDSYQRLTVDLPLEYTRIRAGDVLNLGGRRFEVLTGAGHALEQVMLLCREEGIFLPTDQVIGHISPNVGVHAMEPDADALADFLASLRDIRAQVPADVLVAPTHGRPFHGLHARIDTLIAHHRERCDLLAQAIAAGADTTAGIMPTLFNRKLDAHQMGFAFGEALAHVNHMLALGELRGETDASGVLRLRLA
ncbi:MAG: MBL fold metallo-hydrolase [Acetobacteraceae bacterium]|nr:MBL fold metallo-hydrolase [Acetobacteraceae bacterium]